jgi:hypothetical protein
MRPIRLIAALVFAAALNVLAHAPASAMPTFGQAYGVDCSLCHAAVPALNAYGRYVQRSQYGYLDGATVKKAFPVWVDYQPQYDSQAGAPDTHRVVWGNLALHAVGLIDDNWSYHVQQWLEEDNQGGGLDTAWVSYNGLLKHTAYIEAGKLEVPAPSPYSQWLEIAPFATPEVTVGEHVYELDANRWGGKVGYLAGSTSVDVAYVGSDEDLNGASDWLPPTGKTLQYRAAFMRPKSPIEAGVYGATGTYPISDGSTDRFSAVAGYVQRDPLNGIPGVFAVYQTTHDSYPAAGAPGPSNGRDYTLDVYEPVLHGDVVFGLRREMTDDGMGTVSNSANLDMTIRLAKYVHLYTEGGFSSMNPGDGFNRVGTPAWRGYIWWTMPITKARQ